jgi:hypothetical protein
MLLQGPELRKFLYSTGKSSFRQPRVCGILAAKVPAKLKEIRVKTTLLLLAALLFAVTLIAPTQSSANVPICPPGLQCK